MKKSYFFVFCCFAFVLLFGLFYVLSYVNSKNTVTESEFNYDDKILIQLNREKSKVFASISYVGDKNEAIIAFKKEHLELVQFKSFFGFYKKTSNTSFPSLNSDLPKKNNFYYFNLKDNPLVIEINDYKKLPLSYNEKLVYNLLPSLNEFKLFVEFMFLEKGYDNKYTYYLLTSNKSNGDKTSTIAVDYEVVDFKNLNFLIENKIKKDIK